MSGIAGIVSLMEPRDFRLLLPRMTGKMNFRGPDGIAHWYSDAAGFGQCQLHTTPESLDERMPASSACGRYVIVMDGRVDNREQLLARLRAAGAQAEGSTDSTLVMAAFLRWGEDCLDHMVGDYALAIWDTQARRLFCARDPRGHRALHYSEVGGCFAFATDPAAILSLPWQRAQFNAGLAAEYLSWEWYSEDDTLYRDIYRLPPGEKLAYSTDGVKRQRHWYPPGNKTLYYPNDEDYVAHYAELVDDVIRRQSRSQLTLACHVSGGLDSSAVFAFAARQHQQGRLGAPGIEGYTLAFEDGSDADEIEYARAVADFTGLPVHEIKPFLPSLSWYRDYINHELRLPGYPNGVMDLDMAGVIGRKSAVVLSGVGGDEWLGGDYFYLAESLENRDFGIFFRQSRGEIASAGFLPGLRRILRYGVYPLLPDRLQSGLRNFRNSLKGDVAAESWLTVELATELARRRRAFVPAYGRHPRAGQRAMVELLDSRFSDLGDTDNDAFLARSGIEHRHPLNSQEVIEFAFCLPERLKVKDGVSKWIHRRALKGLLPDTVVDRPTKAEFSSVFNRLDPEVLDLLRQGGPVLGSLVDIAHLRTLLARVENGEESPADSWRLFGLVLCLMIGERLEAEGLGRDE